MRKLLLCFIVAFFCCPAYCIAADDMLKIIYINTSEVIVDGKSLHVGDSFESDSIVGKIGNICSHNVFGYCYNNPVNYSDSKGNTPVVGAVAAGLLAGVVLLVSSNTYLAIDNIVDRVESAKDNRPTYDQSVYVLVSNKGKGEIIYVGRTNDPDRREYEHRHDKKHKERENAKMKVIATGMTVSEARVMEQLVMSSYGISQSARTMDNLRREISLKKLYKYTKADAEASIKLFGTIVEDELKNIMEGNY